MSALTSSKSSDVKLHYGFPGNRLPSMRKLRDLFMKRVFSYVNYNNVYGRWIATQYLRQIKENSRLNNSGCNKWLEILAGKELQTKLRKTENVDFKIQGEQRHSEGKRCQLNIEDVKRQQQNTTITLQTKPTKRGNTDCQCFSKMRSILNRIRTETDEESTRGKFTVKIIRSSMQR